MALERGGRAEEHLAFETVDQQAVAARVVGKRSRIAPSGVMVNSVSSMRPARGTVSRNDMKTPIRTQNSTEMATAENAVTATIAASKRVARRW